jgi:hypothetical protein
MVPVEIASIMRRYLDTNTMVPVEIATIMRKYLDTYTMVLCIDFASVYDYSIGLWKWSDSVVFFGFHVITITSNTMALKCPTTGSKLCSFYKIIIPETVHSYATYFTINLRLNQVSLCK